MVRDRIFHTGLLRDTTPVEYQKPDEHFDPAKLIQKKGKADCTPANVYNPQTW